MSIEPEPAAEMAENADRAEHAPAAETAERMTPTASEPAAALTEPAALAGRPRRQRTRRLLGAGCIAAALVAAAVGWAATRSEDEEVVLSAPTATIDPALLPPTTARQTTIEPTEPTETTLPRSPLADQLGDRLSAIPQPPTDLPVPAAIFIDSIRVNTDQVIAVGVDERGELAVPEASEVGWYELGQRPRQSGATVLAAHVSWKGDSGVFARLGAVEPGAEIVLTMSDGSARLYIVTERTMYGKLDLPADRIWTREGPETLVLITCGGAFNPEIRRYKENIVVYAVPVPDPVG